MYCGFDVLYLWDDGIFQGWTVRDWCVGAVEAFDRGVEFVESFVDNLSSDLGAQSKPCKGLLDNEQPSSLGD